MELKLLMVGLPESGKTTYLAALYELARAKPPVPGAVSERTQPQDVEYFFDINRTWLQTRELDHSNVGAPRHTQLPLLDAQGEPFDLDIPDVAGEDFRAGWEGAHWPAQVAEIAQGVHGVLLFAHGTALTPPARLTAGGLEQTGLPVPPESGDDSEWNAAGAPTQTILADLLEALLDSNGGPIPIALVVSAWDTVKQEITPATWLQVNLPLLWQMLEGRGETQQYEVFGVSAQGGDVTDPQERDRLARVNPPRERISIQRGDDTSRDISAPVRWLLDQAR
jgi:Double-GTPase 1